MWRSSSDCQNRASSVGPLPLLCIENWIQKCICTFPYSFELWIMSYNPLNVHHCQSFVFDISLCVGFAGVGGWLQNNFLTWEYLHKFAIIPTRLWPTQTSPLARIHHSSRFSQYARRAELNMRTALQRIAASIFVSEYSRQNIINIWRHPGTCLNILSNTCAFAI